MTKPGEYEVGYRKPPIAHQFKPGVSGNPRGKPKGARGLKAELAAALDERVTITVNGRPKRIRMLSLIVKAVATKAATGNIPAADKLFSLVIQSQGFEDDRVGKKTLSNNDLQIFARWEGVEPATNDEMPITDDEISPPPSIEESSEDD